MKSFYAVNIYFNKFWSENLEIRMHILKTAVSFLRMRGLNRKKTAR